MLASCLWNSLLLLTHSSRWAFSWVFCMRFAVIQIFWFTFIDFYYWSLFWDSLFYCVAFCRDHLFGFYRNSTDWLSHDVGSGCGESWNRLLTVLYPFFFCLLVLYFYIAPSQVFFQYVSCKLFRRYFLLLFRRIKISILIDLLTCI